jgi:predicted phage replisome organizer
MFDKRKIKKLRRLPEGNNLLLIWIMLLSMAGKCNAGGMIFITESVPYKEEDLADELDFEINTIRLAVNAFKELNMIETSEDGFINIIGWEEYQNIDKLAELREQTRQRVAKHREKQKLLGGNVTCNGDVTLRNAIEEERDEEKDKDIHSFILTHEEAKREFLGGTLGGGVVLMSDEQFEDLCDKLSLDEINHYFGIIKDCELKGKRYTKKTHYQAILDMVAKDRKSMRKKGEDDG